MESQVLPIHKKNVKEKVESLTGKEELSGTSGIRAGWLSSCIPAYVR
jgi:hypothetical protein